MSHRMIVATTPATPLLFVHGLGGTPDVWRGVIEPLGPFAHVVNPELPWSGLQGRGWSATPAAEWIRRALIDLPRPACVVAHSFGANAVLEYLNTYGTHLVDSVALICPFYDAAGTGITAEDRFSLDNFQRLVEEGFRRQMHGRQIPRRILTAMAERVRDRVGLEGWREFLRVFTRTPQLRLRNVNRRCLLLAGEDDRAAPPDDVVALGRLMPTATSVRLSRCGHFAITEEPRQIAASLQELLAPSPLGALCAAS